MSDGLMRAGHSLNSKIFTLLFCSIVYIFVYVLLFYIIGFLQNLFPIVLGSEWDDVLPLRSIDSGEESPFLTAFVVNLLLILLLGVQHSLMPRKFFKSFITRFVPVYLERSVYIVFAIAAFSVLMWQWRPMPSVIWNVENETLRWVVHGVAFAGWLTVFVATFQVGHWKIFGIAQAIDYIEEKPYTFDKPHALSREYYETGWPMSDYGLWRLSRHPDFFGFIVAFWATPTMTVGHLMFAVGMTTYIFIGIFLLERNFKELYHPRYGRYIEGRSLVVPWIPPEKRAAAPEGSTGAPPPTTPAE